MQSKNVIVDTGCANLFSVKYAIERLGFSVTISDDLSLISQADKVILPGVGNAKHAMANIRGKNLVGTLQSLKQPVLGFCLGMQLMAESSTEGIKASTKGIKASTKGIKASTEGIKASTEGIKPSTEGIKSSTEGIKASTEGIKASTEDIKGATSDNFHPDSLAQTIDCLGLIPTKVAPLIAPNQRLPHMGWNTLSSVSDHPVFEGVKVGDYFYFVHSFAAPVSTYTLASCDYGSTFSAAIGKDNFIGCQFHPERSGPLGAKIIRNFLEM
jgi:glutamine amidotransferase